MKLVKLNSNYIQENFKSLFEICHYIDQNVDTEIYAYYDNIEDIKTIVALKRPEFHKILPKKEIVIGTKKEERNNGYATNTLKLFFESINNRTDIMSIEAFVINKASENRFLQTPLQKRNSLQVYAMEHSNFDLDYFKICNYVVNGSYTSEMIEKKFQDEPEKIAYFQMQQKVKEEIKMQRQSALKKLFNPKRFSSKSYS